MIKSIFSQFSKGVFYTLGKFIAYFLIFAFIYFILSKMGVSHETLF